MSTAGQDLQAYVQGFNDADAVRYFTVIGFVILLYDHMITFKDEVRYIWKASTSFAKCAFLFNRYLVPCLLIAIVHETCGFNGNVYGDIGCRALISTACALSILSVCLCNMLALMRVVGLWKDEKTTRRSLYITCICGALSTIVMMLLSVKTLVPDIKWSPQVHMCIVTKTSPYFAATWGAPVFFELHIILAVVYNTIATPRSARVPITAALQRGGLTFFVVVLVLRLFNFVLAVVARPSLSTLGAYFVWAAVTTLINRSLLSLRRVEVKEYKSQLPLPGGRRTESPFGTPIGCDDDDDDDDEEDAPPREPPRPFHLTLHSRSDSSLSNDSRKLEKWGAEW